MSKLSCETALLIESAKTAKQLSKPLRSITLEIVEYGVIVRGHSVNGTIHGHTVRLECAWCDIDELEQTIRMVDEIL